MPTTTDREVALLLEALDRAFDRASWHGPNLRGSVRGLSPDEAVWRPGPGRHNIAEHVLHAAYWKYAVRRRLVGEKRGSFPHQGSNWFPVQDPLTREEWAGHVRLLKAEHGALRGAVAGLTAELLDGVLPGGTGKFTRRASVLGVAAHDVYHAGQIQLLKKLQKKGGTGDGFRPGQG
jgi:hypothetical protein